jgi:DNA-binding Lrp family transcriptional regulator
VRAHLGPVGYAGAKTPKEAAMVSAYVLVSAEPGKSEEVVRALREIQGVNQAHACWGQPDIFAFVEVADDTALSDTVLQTIQGIPGIRGTETHIVIPV